MKYLLLIFTILIISCDNKMEIRHCDCDISSYAVFNYEILEKKFIEMVNKDSLFHADILIDSDVKDPTITMDSLGCYCLAICKKESLIDARFYIDKIGYEITKKYQINEFSRSLINLKIDNNLDLEKLYDSALLSVHVNDKQSWKNELNSDNFSMLFPRQIAPVEGEYIETKLIIE